MNKSQFTSDELRTMLDEYIDYFLADKYGDENMHKAILLIRNKVEISKQLLSVLMKKPEIDAREGHVSAEELKQMIADYESYWNDPFGRGDIEAEKADALPKRILWITKQLIEMMPN